MKVCIFQLWNSHLRIWTRRCSVGSFLCAKLNLLHQDTTGRVCNTVYIKHELSPFQSIFLLKPQIVLCLFAWTVILSYWCEMDSRFKSVSIESLRLDTVCCYIAQKIFSRISCFREMLVFFVCGRTYQFLLCLSWNCASALFLAILFLGADGPGFSFVSKN